MKTGIFFCNSLDLFFFLTSIKQEILRHNVWFLLWFDQVFIAAFLFPD